jgi:predicted adenylyl cyclase CyaB
MLEAEVRSFITEADRKRLIQVMDKEANFIEEDEQETHYLDGPVDLRIQRSKNRAKLWVKTGKIHDSVRDETEVTVRRDDFDKLGQLLNLIGFEVEIKWFRKRRRYDWKGIKVCLDTTKGYGEIVELETKCDDSEKEVTVQMLRQKLETLKVKETPRAVFEERFQHYKKNWKELVGE